MRAFGRFGITVFSVALGSFALLRTASAVSGSPDATIAGRAENRNE